MNLLYSLALALYDIGAVKDRRQSPDGIGFKLKLHERQPDAPLSPIYLNLRTADNPKPGPLTQAIVTEIGEAMFLVAQKLSLTYDVVAGIPRAGEPFALAFASLVSATVREMPCLFFSKEEQAGGRKVTELLDGPYRVENTILLIDDLVTQADTKLEAIGACERRGLIVRDLLVLVDREQGGVQILTEKGYKVHALFTLRELLNLYLRAERLSQDIYDEIVAYLAG